ncbi:regulator of chromosome condensation 1/beta-lactamase-inhibitor protein II [Halteromyces radiatus]|uniref:regulator of chromosome condensation 1/beta-lactamase-inhibitor protein II n=1 Tax=Halteromyces radiatus TaxID=101107 RepID=UPI00221F2FA0|nr:regulator of chromosome condensation 1/beta-lactamase-inhibitor protein II [Halteromyces radiatus]KAI8086252.1 regulator of chromosome condensation 1/beta-lactamase-inhibitor protein II [Halteromyces radiatus]
MNTDSKTTLQAFGFNAFQQLSKKKQVKIKATHNNIVKILLATWESTFLLTDQGAIELYGFKTTKLETLVDKWNKNDIRIKHIFGDIVIGLGIIDETGKTYWWCLQKDKDFQVNDGLLLAENIKDAGICQNMGRLYLLSVDGKVIVYDLKQLEKKQYDVLTLPRVSNMAMSPNHVLFAVEGITPIYGLGSNRMGQLGIEQLQHTDTPVALEFFDGLGTMISDDNTSTSQSTTTTTAAAAVKVSCGPFHSAVVIEHDLYTFGWNDHGRIGWGNNNNDDDNENNIKLAAFKWNDSQNNEDDILVDNVSCGSKHTVAIDVNGIAWTCGSNGYLQLGRETNSDEEEDYDDYFRPCSLTNWVIECKAGPWSTLLLETTRTTMSDR